MKLNSSRCLRELAFVVCRAIRLQMSTQPHRSGFEGGARMDSTTIRLVGGHAEKPRIIAAFRDSEHVDVEAIVGTDFYFVTQV